MNDQPVQEQTRKGKMLQICFIWGCSIAVIACFIAFTTMLCLQPETD